MNRTLLRFTIVVAGALVASALGSSAFAQEGQFFILKSKASNRCLHVKNGDKPTEAVIELFDPCQSTADFRVQRVIGSEALRIKATPTNFTCLQVKQPFTVHDLPIKVTAGNCVEPSAWSIPFPEEADDFRRVILRREGVDAAVCLQEVKNSSELVVGLCDASSSWKFDPVSPP